jgi:hypothetical protein
MTKELEDFIEKVRPFILGNITHPYFTLELCEKVRDIEGDFCECGVAYGGTSAVMAKYLMTEGINKMLHMWDSFQGIPYPTQKDGHPIDNIQFPKTGELKSTGISVGSLDNVMNLMKVAGINPDILMYYYGWLEESLPILHSKMGKLSFLRIDVDLYRPTMYCLRYLYPKLSSGGYVLMHDDGKALAGPRKAVADYVKNNRKGIKIHHFPDEGGLYWRKP